MAAIVLDKNSIVTSIEERPKDITVDRSARLLRITWADAHLCEYSLPWLRANCPCATCREKHSAESKPEKQLALPVLSLAEARPLRIDHMRPVGNYAYNIGFSDGHDSGIFTFDLLRELGQPR